MRRTIITLIAHSALVIAVIAPAAWAILYLLNRVLTFLWTVGGIAGADSRPFPHRFFAITTLCAIAVACLRFVNPPQRPDDNLRDPIPLPCRACGYNLHANVSGVCPECGTIVKAELAISKK
jgi:hypothetical protein